MISILSKTLIGNTRDERGKKIWDPVRDSLDDITVFNMIDFKIDDFSRAVMQRKI